MSSNFGRFRTNAYLKVGHSQLVSRPRDTSPGESFSSVRQFLLDGRNVFSPATGHSEIRPDEFRPLSTPKVPRVVVTPSARKRFTAPLKRYLTMLLNDVADSASFHVRNMNTSPLTVQTSRQNADVRYSYR